MGSQRTALQRAQPGAAGAGIAGQFRGTWAGGLGEQQFEARGLARGKAAWVVARGGGRAAGLLHEKALHDAVFQGVERYDDQTPAWGEQRGTRFQRAGDFAELVVDADAQRLKAAGGGIDAVVRFWHHAANDAGQLRRGFNRRLRARRDNRAGDPAGVAFLAKFVERVG